MNQSFTGVFYSLIIVKKKMKEPKAQAPVQRRTNQKATDDGKGNLSERSELMLTYRRKKLEIQDYALLAPPKDLLVVGRLSQPKLIQKFIHNYEILSFPGHKKELPTNLDNLKTYDANIGYIIKWNFTTC